MAKRASSVAVNVEYVSTANKRQLAASGVNVEYVETLNKFRLAAFGVMVEYNTTPPGRSQGPAAQ